MASTVPDQPVSVAADGRVFMVHQQRREALAATRQGLDMLERAAVCFTSAAGHAEHADLPTGGTRIVLAGFVEQLRNMRDQAMDERDTLADSYAQALTQLEATR